MFKKTSNIILAYFTILLVSFQVIANVIAIFNKEFYYSIGFYLNTFIGTNVLFSFFLLTLAFKFNFCKISRAAAIAEVIFALAYLIIQEDNVYNISIQIIVGTIALIYTLYKYTKIFPNCKFSLALTLLMFMAKKRDCVKGIESYQDLCVKNYHKNGC